MVIATILLDGTKEHQGGEGWEATFQSSTRRGREHYEITHVPRRTGTKLGNYDRELTKVIVVRFSPILRLLEQTHIP